MVIVIAEQVKKGIHGASFERILEHRASIAICRDQRVAKALQLLENTHMTEFAARKDTVSSIPAFDVEAKTSLVPDIHRLEGTSTATYVDGKLSILIQRVGVCVGVQKGFQTFERVGYFFAGQSFAFTASFGPPTACVDWGSPSVIGRVDDFEDTFEAQQILDHVHSVDEDCFDETASLHHADDIRLGSILYQQLYHL